MQQKIMFIEDKSYIDRKVGQVLFIGVWKSWKVGFN